MSYRDKHAATFKPATTAAEERDAEHDNPNDHCKGVNIEELMLREKSGVLGIRKPKPYSEPDDAAAR